MEGMERQPTPDGEIAAMKSLLSNDYVAIAVRIFVGFLFIFASVDKIAAPDAFAASISNYKLLGTMAASVIATVLPWVELLCGFGLVFGAFPRGSSLILTTLLVVFTVAVFTALFRGLDISCGCFTQDPQAGKVSWEKITENLGLILLTTFLFYSTSVKFTLEHYLSNHANEASH